MYDIMTAITGNDSKNPSDNFGRLCERFPEVRYGCANFKFPGQGQKPTPVTDARGFVMILNLLPGEKAAHFRMSSADIIVRYLGGDQSLLAEINRNAAAQEVLPENNIGKLFGATVAASTAIVPASNRPELESVTGFVDMRAPQHYLRSTPGSMWTNVHPLGRPDKLVSPETLMKPPQTLIVIIQGFFQSTIGNEFVNCQRLPRDRVSVVMLQNSLDCIALIRGAIRSDDWVFERLARYRAQEGLRHNFRKLRVTDPLDDRDATLSPCPPMAVVSSSIFYSDRFSGPPNIDLLL